MQFLCLMYCEARYFEEASPQELSAFQEACAESDRSLTRSGHLLSALPLESARSATTVRTKNGVARYTDGPFAETKEQLCGFVLIEARDREEAKSIAASQPFARVGSVEIRPVMNLGGAGESPAASPSRT